MGFLDKLFGASKPASPPAPAAKAPEKQGARDWEAQSVPQDYSPREVQAMLESPTPPSLLDVREDHELAADGFLPGSLHIPMGQVEARLGELDRTRPIIVYCASGMRSFDVGFLLIQNGFKDVGNLNGGIRAWAGTRERRN